MISKSPRKRLSPRNGRAAGNKFLYQWLPPSGSRFFFYSSSDTKFQAAHPVGYVFLVIFGMTALLLPFIAYAICILSADPHPSGWFWLGEAGAFIIGIGLFNFVSIIIKQYLGHLVSILSFLIGGILIAISLRYL